MEPKVLEPSLFLAHCGEAPVRFAAAFGRVLREGSQ